MRNKLLIIISICIAITSLSKSACCKIPKKNEASVSIVVIDPGHGGKDFGASVGNAREKDIVLDLALRLGQSIKSKYPEIKVIYTRSTDIFIPLHERARIANKNKADLFISIHINGVDNNYAQGTETFVLGQHRSKDNLEVAKKENSVILLEDNYETTYEGFDPNSPESYIMFELVQDEYLDQSVMFASEIQMQFREYANRVDRSVKQAGFLVLRQATMPSVLIEAGFVTHPEERTYLVSESGKKVISNAIFNAFEVYKHKTENQSSFAVQTENKSMENSESEITTQTEITETMIQPEKNESSMSVKNNVYYSVQIAASKNKLEPVAANFKGLKNVFRTELNGMFRYYSGRFETENEAEKQRKNITQKFPDSFVVVFENEKSRSLKKTP